MIRISKVVATLAMAFVLTFTAVANVSADSSDALTGSWDLLADGAGAESTVLITFHEGGTITGSAPQDSFSAIHGIWKKIGPRTVVAKTRSYMYGTNGNVNIRSTEVIEISEDGNSYTTVIENVIELPDGTTTVNIVNATASRVTFD